MKFGVPKETRPMESRVGLTPASVDSLTRAGQQVLVESGAGLEAHFSDDEYQAAGAQLVYDQSEVFGRADTIVKIGRPTKEEYQCFRPYQVVFSYLHLAVASPDLLETFQEKKLTAIGYECIKKDDGSVPVLRSSSEITGRLAPIIAGDLLGSFRQGRGILLNGIPGAPPADVIILGAGVLGINAARSFYDLGAQVTILDHDLDALQECDRLFGGKIATMFANSHNISKVAQFADVLVCCAAVPGRKAQLLIDRNLLARMNRRSVILDFAINSGGNVMTSRPTTLANPHYLDQDIVHYAVPNVPAMVARTASYAHCNAILPYLLKICEFGVTEAFRQMPDLHRGVNILEGILVHPDVSAALGSRPEVDTK